MEVDTCRVEGKKGAFERVGVNIAGRMPAVKKNLGRGESVGAKETRRTFSVSSDASVMSFLSSSQQTSVVDRSR
jgi:hypothetical protein